MITPKKIMLVFGTRPEAIKMASIYYALKAIPEEFDTTLCVTGQHRQMLDQVLKVFEIKPDIDLNLMKSGQDLFDITAAVLLGMRETLLTYKPDILLVHGDTSTTLAAAMAGFYLGIPIGHIEAGLRTHDLQAPFPEEFNRQVVSKLASWHFSPTEFSKKNLLDENVPEANITVTGNTVIDSLFWVLERIATDDRRRNLLCSFLNEQLGFDWKNQRFVLMTGHRRENFGDGFLQICHALKDLAIRYPDVQFVYPVHLNPNVQNPVNSILANLPNVHLITPLDYEPFAYLLKHSYIVLTDSGGIQEEAPSLGKPVLVMRDLTERPEAIEAGTVRLVGAYRGRIVDNVSDLLDNPVSYLSMARAHNPYGNGNACGRIVSILREI
jgi:UDP-N-acetylglucosamine 2-epimerase (non-hydrolysing)